MKDIITAISILLILSVLLSCYGPIDHYEVSKVEEKHNGNKTAGDSGDVETGGGAAGFTPPTPADKTNIELAYEVIKGEWGNGYTRKRLMREAGHDYYEVQELVNTLLGVRVDVYE